MSRYNFSGTATSLLFLCMLVSSVVYSQEQKKTLPNGTDGLELTAPDSSKSKGLTKLSATEVEAPWSTFKIGMGFIYDVTGYQQNAVFKQQMDSLGLNLKALGKVRDFRILGSGVLRTKRPISWKFAYMYDGSVGAWLIRESGVTIGVPELWGNIFIGRTKEGFSLPKVMNGHSPWTNERQMAIDLIPILGDGIKWIGYEKNTRIFWNLGAYNDFISKGQGFSTFSSQYTARIGFLAINEPQNRRVLHIGANLRYGRPLDGKFAIKSRPESNPTPFLITSGTFAADHSTHIGYEIYYSSKRFMIGSEGVAHNFYSNQGNHHFWGGDFVLSYFLTNTFRPYRTEGAIFGFVNVRRSVFKGGMGEFEAVLRTSTFNVNDGNIRGGQLTRITPMINWYMSRIVRMEFTYGYVFFNRFDLKGQAQLFESRIQFTVM